jgi:tellurite resistance protein
MQTEDRINLLAKVARTPHGAVSGASDKDRSILLLAAASYGARPNDEATIPTGFDANAALLFEAIVEGAYLVASADGVFDDAERSTFERVVTAACGGAVPHGHVADLLADLADQLQEDGLDRRIARLSEGLARPEHAREVLRIAALLAHASEDVSEVERMLLERLATAFRLGEGAVDDALSDVKASLSS